MIIVCIFGKIVKCSLLVDWWSIQRLKSWKWRVRESVRARHRVMSFDGDNKQWICGKGGTVNLQRVSSIVRDIGEPCLHQSPIKVVIAVRLLKLLSCWFNLIFPFADSTQLTPLSLCLHIEQYMFWLLVFLTAILAIYSYHPKLRVLLSFSRHSKFKNLVSKTNCDISWLLNKCYFLPLMMLKLEVA